VTGVATGIVLRPEPLTAARFAPYGDVLESEGSAFRWINAGTAKRYETQARVEVTTHGGRPLISIFEATPRSFPLSVRVLERHPWSSQAFFPLEQRPFLIVVAGEGPGPLATRVQSFLSSGRQGVNYRPNTWHHPLVALAATSRFLVVDRGGEGENCEEIEFEPDAVTLLGGDG
jgi:ureidoglycolate lyase